MIDMNNSKSQPELSSGIPTGASLVLPVLFINKSLFWFGYFNESVWTSLMQGCPILLPEDHSSAEFSFNLS